MSLGPIVDGLAWLGSIGNGGRLVLVGIAVLIAIARVDADGTVHLRLNREAFRKMDAERRERLILCEYLLLALIVAAVFPDLSFLFWPVYAVVAVIATSVVQWLWRQ